MTQAEYRTDQLLLAKIASRDQQALADLYARYSQPVYNLAKMVARDTVIAEEVTQDVFMLVWKTPEKWQSDKGRLISWLLTVARYMAIDRLRKEKRDLMAYAAPFAQDEHELKARAEPKSEDDVRLMKSILQRLPQEQKQVVLLAYYRGMTHSQIAKHLSIPEGTVKSRLRLGLQKIRQQWHAATRELEHL